MQPKPYYLVAIDINPSLELYLDSEKRVREVKSLNPDAEKLLNDLSLKKLSLDDAIDHVLRRSSALGFIDNDKENMIMVAVTTLRGNSVVDSAAIESAVTKTMQSVLISGFLRVEQTDQATYTLSKEKGLSINKWLIIKQAEKLGIEFNTANMASKRIEKVLEDAGIDRTQFFMPIGASSNREQNENQIAPVRETVPSNSLSGRTDGPESSTGAGTSEPSPQNRPSSGQHQDLNTRHLPDSSGLPPTSGQSHETGTFEGLDNTITSGGSNRTDSTGPSDSSDSSDRSIDSGSSAEPSANPETKETSPPAAGTGTPKASDVPSTPAPTPSPSPAQPAAEPSQPTAKPAQPAAEPAPTPSPSPAPTPSPSPAQQAPNT
jgi:hypothetical protein